MVSSTVKKSIHNQQQQHTKPEKPKTAFAALCIQKNLRFSKMVRSSTRKCSCPMVKSSSFCPFANSCDDDWSWLKTECSLKLEVRSFGAYGASLLFHPDWSTGTLGARGNKPLNGTISYWEIQVSNRLLGTSTMFGIGNLKASLCNGTFMNLLGSDSNSWGLSHKGLLWHNGQSRPATNAFQERVAVTIGLLFDGIKGSLTYFKDGICLGVAFENIPLTEEIYPMVSATAARTEMTLTKAKRCFYSLQDMCQWTVAQNCKTKQAIADLPLPKLVKLQVQAAKRWENELHSEHRVNQEMQEMTAFC